MSDIYELIEEKDLTDDLRLIAEVSGIEAVRNLLRNFGGVTFYIPKLTRLDQFLKRYIMENSNKSVKILARDFFVSETYIRQIIKKK
ncbi:MAG: hypothetical protein NT007_16720 [Candidatus Kapabacteria bacterium]|nr:hypothetical protein [Candidatus Kapabacteria bacterium]